MIRNSARQLKAVSVIIVCCVTGLYVSQPSRVARRPSVTGLYVSQPSRVARRPSVTVLATIQKEKWVSVFDKPLDKNTTDCRRLFEEPKEDKYFYPNTYLEQWERFEAVLKRMSEYTFVEGHSSVLKHQSRLYYWLASWLWVKAICETGFNAGYSSLQWLTGSDHAKVYSFDIGTHYYTHHMADYLNRTFPGRLEMIIGDSRETIPEFATTRPDVKCDVLVIDGGHSHPVAFADIWNFQRLARPGRNVVLVDDKNKPGIRRAWKDMRVNKVVVEKFACTDFSMYGRGYVMGYYRR